MVLISFLVWALSQPQSAHAEYRVYQLAITDAKTNQSRVVLSTLDDIQYPGYHPLNPGESIAIQDTWRCWQRADGFKELCPNTRAPANVGSSTNRAAPAISSPSTGPGPSANSLPVAP